MNERWGIYIRVSTRQQAEDGFSLQDQKEKLIAYAESQGWTWKLFEDPGVSGERLDRPGLLALLEAGDRGDINGVLVFDESRLGRSDLVSATIRERLRRAGVALAMPGRGVVDLADPAMLFTTQVLASAAALEQNIRTQKMKDGLRNTVEAGYWPGGPAPYGYRLVPSDDGRHTKLAVDADEADVLRLVADLITNKGYSTYSAAAHVNGLGIRTRRNSPWRHPNLSWQLRKQHTTGTFVYDPTGVSISISIPAIFSQDKWETLQRAIKGKPRPHRKNRVYALTGRGRTHLKCACGGNFFGYSDTSKRSKIVYECAQNDHALGDSRCPHLPRVTPAEALENAVWDQVVTALTDAEYLARLAAEHLTAISDVTPGEIVGLERRLGQLRSEETSHLRRMAVDVLHTDAIERALDEVASERITVEKELERLQEAQRGALSVESVPEATQRLSRLAAARLADPSVELMAEVFDLLEVDLIRIEGRTFEGVARLPLPDPDSGGEVWEGGPRDPLSNLPWSEVRVPFPICVELPTRWIANARSRRGGNHDR